MDDFDLGLLDDKTYVSKDHHQCSKAGDPLG
jgi:hypothetical protein